MDILLDGTFPSTSGGPARILQQHIKIEVCSFNFDYDCILKKEGHGRTLGTPHTRKRKPEQLL